MAEKNITPTNPDAKAAEVEEQDKTETERKTAGVSGRFRKMGRKTAAGSCRF